MNSKQNCWLAAYVFANTNRLFLWPLSSLHQCFLSVQFATICSNQSVLTDFYQKSFQVLVLKMLTFCYLGLKKVTLVNQLSLLLIFKTTIGETWNAAIIKLSIFLYCGQNNSYSCVWCRKKYQYLQLFYAILELDTRWKNIYQSKKIKH